MSKVLERFPVGTRYNQRVITDHVPILTSKGKLFYYEVRCDCGNISTIKATSFKAGKGCCKKCYPRSSKVRTIKVGQVFSYLTVIGFDPNKYDHIICKCDCGQIISKHIYSVFYGNTQSCGCLRIKNKNRINQGYKYVLATYKCSAKKNKREFTLTENQFMSIIKSNCFYCGANLSNSTNHIVKNLHYNGIDRIDSSKGYTIDNTVSCCKMCNIAKHNHSQQDFLDMCRRIALLHPVKV